MFQVVQSLGGRKMCGPFPGAPASLSCLLAASAVGFCQTEPCNSLDNGPPNSHDLKGRGPLAGGLLEAAPDPM